MGNKLTNQRSSSEFKKFTTALKQGQDTAWREFFELYHHRIRAYIIKSWHGDSHLIDDIVQDTMVRAVKYFRVSSEEKIMWSWLTVLAKSAVADQGRRRNSFLSFIKRFSKHSDNYEKSETLPDEHLNHAINTLKENERLLIQLKYNDNLSVREIANQLAVSEKAIESRLSRCRKKLSTHMQKLKQ